MSFGMAACGFVRDADGNPTDQLKTMRDYQDDMIRVTESDLVDIMLTSLSTAETLTSQGLYADTPVTPAVRVNDSSDIWNPRGANYRHLPAAPFRTPRLDRVRAVSDLGLYAISFYNDLQVDLHTLERYAAFRDEASAAGVRHILEVFNPQYPVATGDAAFADYNNDAITRCLAGVSRFERPVFLKAVYNGPKSTEALAAFDPGHLVVGILGGASGTNRDTLELVKQAEKYGARVALFGRKIYFAESSVEIIRTMRDVIEQDLSSEDGTKLYHDRLAKAGLKPFRDLASDLELTDPILKQ